MCIVPWQIITLFTMHSWNAVTQGKECLHTYNRKRRPICLPTTMPFCLCLTLWASQPGKSMLWGQLKVPELYQIPTINTVTTHIIPWLGLPYTHAFRLYRQHSSYIISQLSCDLMQTQKCRPLSSNHLLHLLQVHSAWKHYMSHCTECLTKLYSICWVTAILILIIMITQLDVQYPGIM